MFLRAVFDSRVHPASCQSQCNWILIQISKMDKCHLDLSLMKGLPGYFPCLPQHNLFYFLPLFRKNYYPWSIISPCSRWRPVRHCTAFQVSFCRAFLMDNEQALKTPPVSKCGDASADPGIRLQNLLWTIRSLWKKSIRRLFKYRSTGISRYCFMALQQRINLSLRFHVWLPGFIFVSENACPRQEDPHFRRHLRVLVTNLPAPFIPDHGV